MVGIACPSGGNAGDGQRKADGNVGGVAVGSEADFATGEAIHELEGRISARLPRPPDAKGSLADVDIAGTLFPGPVASMDARSTD